MTAYQKKLHIINKRDALSLKFKDVLCFQSSLRYFFPILQIFDAPGSISLFQGNQSPNSIEYIY